MSYAYNSADQLIQMTYPSGRTVDYTRNVLGQIDTVTTTQGANTSTLSSNASYQPFGPMESMTYGNGLTRSHTFDLDYRLTGMTVPAILQRAYSYDNANNITGIANTLDASRDQVLGYDELNRLTAANGVYGSFSYSYDANGNRTTQVMDGHPENYTYDTTSHHLLQTVNGGTRNYSYDANGNTTSNTDRDFVYGENNRLKEAQLNGSPLASYTYNGRGERVLKQGTDTTLYTYDQNGQLIAELDDQGNTLREYIYIDGQPLGYVTNNQVHFVHTDHLGTPQVITDASQQIVWQADYEPFGQTTLTTQTVTYNPRFPGQYFDSETGLHYNYFRDYDPSIGRYIQSDPIGLRGGLNTYVYAFLNPILFFDKNGLRAEPCNITPPDGYICIATGRDPITYELIVIFCRILNVNGAVTVEPDIRVVIDPKNLSKKDSEITCVYKNKCGKEVYEEDAFVFKKGFIDPSPHF